MKRACLVVIVGALVAAGCGGGSSGGSSSKSGAAKNGHVNITVWEGYTQAESTAIKALANQFNASHPNITVTPQFYGNNDYALQKVLAAIAGGKPPDISYLYGSNAANIAGSPGIVPLNKLISSDPSFGWSNFYPSERKVATVNGKIVGVPALVDNLALVYNKKLFAQAGIAPPTANWTWSDFENAALKLTDPSKKQFGWAYVNDASEDTVWRFWAMLWQAGGSILTPTASRRRSAHRPGSRRSRSCRHSPSTRRSTSTTARATTSRCSTPGTSGCCGRDRGTCSRSPPPRSATGCRSCRQRSTTRRSRAPTTG
jgi:ABC-type sugar transport system, periplasmic component